MLFLCIIIIITTTFFQLNIKFQIFRKSRKWQYFFFVVVVNLHAIIGIDTLITGFHNNSQGRERALALQFALIAGLPTIA